MCPDAETEGVEFIWVLYTVLPDETALSPNAVSNHEPMIKLTQRLMGLHLVSQEYRRPRSASSTATGPLTRLTYRT